MPRRSILSAADRDRLLALPDHPDDLIRLYTFSESDLAIIHLHRGAANRLGFALQLCYLRYPGVVLGPQEAPFPPLLRLVATQIQVPPESWSQYGQREETRREHLVELQTVFGFQPFTLRHYRPAVHSLRELAWQTDKGIVLAEALIDRLRRQSILLPTLPVIERLCAEAITQANRRIYRTLTAALSDRHRQRLDELLKRKPDNQNTWLAWLRQSPGAPTSRQMLEHLERLQTWQGLDLPAGIAQQVHQNRLLKIAREGGQMTPRNLAKFEPQRRYATLVALALEGTATVIDECVALHDRIMGKLFNAARNRHQQQFQQSGKAINDKVRLYARIGQALLDAKQTGADPFVAIESILSWQAFAASVTEAQQLAQPEDFDFLPGIGAHYATLRRYAPQFLRVLNLRAAPVAQELLEAIAVLCALNTDHARKLPREAPTGFIPKRWEKLIFSSDGLDRRYYELCVLSELKNALRSGDIWVQGSRQYKAFDEYLLPVERFAALRQANALPLAVATDGERYLQGRVELLEQQLATVNRLAQTNDLPEASITPSGLKITPLEAAVPEAAQTLIDQTAMLLPHLKITDLLLEVDEWTGFTRHFTHLKTGTLAPDKTRLLTVILADAINLGLAKMAESCPGTTYARLAWLQAWHVRDETYSAALAELVNAQFQQPFATWWGDGTTSSSDGQRFRAGGRGESTGHINPKYGSEPAGCSTPISPTSTRPSIPPWSTSACASRPTCSTVCCTTSPTCASRSITPIPPVSPITSSP
jgi:TnpA family transposase